MWLKIDHKIAIKYKVILNQIEWKVTKGFEPPETSSF